MPRLRRLSGAEVVAILGRFGFAVVSQHGSHIKLRRAGIGGKQVLTAPAHPTLDPALFAQFSDKRPGLSLKKSYTLIFTSNGFSSYER